jgi:hypothetical protein
VSWDPSKVPGQRLFGPSVTGTEPALSPAVAVSSWRDPEDKPPLITSPTWAVGQALGRPLIPRPVATLRRFTTGLVLGIAPLAGRRWLAARAALPAKGGEGSQVSPDSQEVSPSRVLLGSPFPFPITQTVGQDSSLGKRTCRRAERRKAE